jgi:RNA-binding protein Luc7-like 2
MDEVRKQLDALMGTNRNGDNKEVQKHFTDPDVCRNFLCGLCPHDLFTNTKMDLGECPKLHSIPLRMEYENASNTKHFGFEYELLQTLERIIIDCDRKVIKNRKRLEETEANEKAQHELADEIDKLVKESERLGEEGRIDESIELLKKAEQLKSNQSTEKLETLKSLDLPMGIGNQQKLRVCEVCSAYLSLQDSDKRLADHFGGKMHIGFMQVREKAEEIKNKFSKENTDRLHGKIDRDIVHDRERDQWRDRDRSRRGRESDIRERERDRDRDRYREKHRHHRSRSRDRERSREKERKYS